LGVAAFAAAMGGTARAQTLDKTALGCQTTIGKAALGFTSDYLKAFSSYLNAEMKASGSGDASKRDAALANAESKFDAATAKKCDPSVVGSDVLTPAPPAGIGFPVGTCGVFWGEAAPEEAYEQACAALPAGTFPQKQACWKCFLQGELREWLKGHYPWVQGLVPQGSDLCGTPPVVALPPDSATLKCLTTVPKLANKLRVTVEKTIGKCLNGALKSGAPISMCMDPSPAIDKAQTKLTDGIAKACPTLPLWWDQCFETQNPTCPGSVIANVAQIGYCSEAAEGGAPYVQAPEIICSVYPSLEFLGFGPSCRSR
jgi:hypothetical protein